MKENWKRYKINDIAEKVGIGPFGSSIKVETFVDKGIPIISGAHLKGNRLEDNDFNFITEEHADRLLNANVYRGDVIFTHAGNIGAVSYIPNTSKYERYILSQRQFYLRCNKSKLLPEFITYYFKSPEGQKKLLANTSYSGVPSIAQPVTYLKSIEVDIPEIDQQKKIVEILTSLDNKIELNLQMNQTLEAIAQAIFKEWFSGNGMVLLSEYIEINPHLTIKKDAKVKYVEMANLPESGFSIKSYVERPYSSGSKFQNKDTLLARITPCLENGKTGFVDFLDDEEIAFGSTEFIVMRAKGFTSPYFVYLIAREYNFRQFAIKSMSGTSGRQRVQKDLLNTFEIPKTNESTMREFDLIVHPLFVKIKNNFEENKTLTAIRDSLLPKLIAGKIEVKE